MLDKEQILAAVEADAIVAVNDKVLVVVPIIKEKTEGGIIKDRATLDAELKAAKDEIYVASIGNKVSPFECPIEAGDRILVNGQVVVLGNQGVRCSLPGYEYAYVTGYHIAVVLNVDYSTRVQEIRYDDQD